MGSTSCELPRGNAGEFSNATGYALPMPSPKPRRRGTDRALQASPPLSGIETALHTTCVKAGAAAALLVAVERLPLLKPFLPKPISRAARSDAPERLQRMLVKDIYARHGVRPAAWEVEGILAVAQTQSTLTPLATQEGLDSILRIWLPRSMVAPLLRYTPLQPLVTATAKAVAATWAAGRYADSVCRLRKAGADWLPAPLHDALNLAPAKLRNWSAEALTLALPPLRLAKAWSERSGLGSLAGQFLRARPLADVESPAPPTRRAPAKKKKKSPA
jgi:hypothetical protein